MAVTQVDMPSKSRLKSPAKRARRAAAKPARGKGHWVFTFGDGRAAKAFTDVHLPEHWWAFFRP